MAYLLTDAKQYRQLPCPATVTIGRGTDCSIRPDSQSVSKNHALLHLARVPDTGRVEIWIEDLNSRNGTFVGESPLDFERVNGKRRLYYGEYIRFGHSQKFFRLLDQIPTDNEPEIVVVPASSVIPPKNTYGNDPNAGGFNRESKDDTRAFGESRLAAPMVPNNTVANTRFDVRPGSATQDAVFSHEEDNDDFNVVLKYNTKRNQSSQPVSLYIGGSNDGSVRGSHGSDGKAVSNRGAERYNNQSYDDSGRPYASSQGADAKVQFRMDDDAAEFLSPVGGSQDNFRTLANSNSMEALHEMRNAALGDIGDSKEIMRESQWAKRNPGAPRADHMPKVFFHAYASPIFSKEHVLKYLAGLRDWEQYVMKGIDPTSAKADIFFRQLLEDHSSNTLSTRNAREIIEMPKVVQLYQRLSPPEKESLSAELIVDTIQANAAQGNQSVLHDVGQSILALQALNRSCRLGINEDDHSKFNRYGEVDMALMEEITGIVKREMQRLAQLEQIQLAVSLRAIAGSGHLFNVERLFFQSNNVLLSVQSFLSTILQEEKRAQASSYLGTAATGGDNNANSPRAISASECFEVISLCLLEILWRLWQAYSTLLCLLAIVQEMVTQKVLEGGGSIAGAEGGRVEGLLGHGATAMPNLHLLREKMMNGDEESVLQVLQEFKSQHVNTAFMRFGRVQRLFEILRKLSLRSAFRQWSMRGFQMKKRGLQLMEAEDVVINRYKGRFFRTWFKAYARKKQKRKALYRMIRSIKGNHRIPLAMAFKQWKDVAGFNVNLHPSLSAMRMQLLKLQNDLDVCTNTDQTAGVLAAERALNKELIASNAHLRDTLQEYEMKILESSSLPMAKKQELVYQFLQKKEEELIDARKESRMVKAELEALRNSIANRRPVPSSSQGGQSSAPPRMVPMSTNPYRPAPPTAGHQSSLHPHVLHQQQQQQQQRPGLRLHPSGDEAALMSKDEAKLIVLNEVRRLKDSLTQLQSTKEELHANYATEQDKNVQLSLANQSLANRVIELERSAVLLRELLLQRLGATAVLDLTEAMAATGAGAHILLNTLPVTSTASAAPDASTGVRRQLEQASGSAYPVGGSAGLLNHQRTNRSAGRVNGNVTTSGGVRQYNPDGSRVPSNGVSAADYKDAVSAAFFKGGNERLQDVDDDEEDYKESHSARRSGRR